MLLALLEVFGVVGVVDGVGGLWNVNLGFSCEPIKQAISDQLDRLPYYSIFRGTTNDAAVELSYELAQFFEPDGLQRAFYTSGGGDSGQVYVVLLLPFTDWRVYSVRNPGFLLGDTKELIAHTNPI